MYMDTHFIRSVIFFIRNREEFGLMSVHYLFDILLAISSGIFFFCLESGNRECGFYNVHSGYARGSKGGYSMQLYRRDQYSSESLVSKMTNYASGGAGSGTFSRGLCLNLPSRCYDR